MTGTLTLLYSLASFNVISCPKSLLEIWGLEDDKPGFFSPHISTSCSLSLLIGTLDCTKSHLLFPLFVD